MIFHRWRAAHQRTRDLRAALALQRQGRLAEAEALYRAVLQRDPDQVRALFNLGLARVRQGALDDAIALFEQALSHEPNLAEAHNALGIALRLAGRHQEALARHAQALAVKPDYPEAENDLGLALQALGRPAEAVGHHTRAIALKPDYAEAENNLGAALRALHHYEAAVEHYQRAAALRPDSAAAHNNLGVALQLLNRHEDALAEAEQAVALAPGFAEAHHGRGTVLRTLGRLEEACESLEHAITLSPRKAEFYRSLAEAKHFAEGDPYCAMAEALAQDIGSLTDEDRIHLHFALGKIYDDLGQHERGFCHLREGNALKRKQTAYDEAAVLGRFAATIDLFGAEVMRERADQGDPSSSPVFIIGMPRSGTTLVEQILASHPEVYGAGELRDFEQAVAALGGPDGVPTDIGGAELRRLGASYLAKVAPLALDARRITDKMPANFRYAGLIHLALPNARIVHISRDPVDTCLSCFSILFGGDQPFTYELGELGRYYRAYQRLMAHWRAVLPPAVLLDLQYEALVGDFDSEARRVLAHCGLEWNDSCRAFYRTQRPVHTASSAQVRRPLYRSSIGRWRPPADVLRPLLDALAAD